jgi:ribonuclease-3 family protein
MYPILQPIEKERARQMNAVVLAFVGDAAYTLFVRRELALQSPSKTGELNVRASAVVSAHGQSESLERILPLLTEEESEIYHRGRNAKKPTKSKNATAIEYCRSTGFEAVIGYLYLTGNIKRIEELFFEGV